MKRLMLAGLLIGGLAFLLWKRNKKASVPTQWEEIFIPAPEEPLIAIAGASNPDNNNTFPIVEFVDINNIVVKRKTRKV